MIEGKIRVSCKTYQIEVIIAMLISIRELIFREVALKATTSIEACKPIIHSKKLNLQTQFILITLMNPAVSSKLSSYLIFCLIFSAIIVASSCKKDEKNDVAQYSVNFTIYLNDPSNIALNAVGGWVYVNAGTKGIIIYRRGLEDFTALERNCTYDPNASCAIVQVLSGISAIDSCCTSRFSIFDGSVINGPATQPLYQYKTYYNGTALRVYN